MPHLLYLLSQVDHDNSVAAGELRKTLSSITLNDSARTAADLSNGNLGPDQIKILADALKDNTTLTLLDLKGLFS